MGLFVDEPNLQPQINTLNKSLKYGKRQTRAGLADIRAGVDEAQPYLERSVDNYEGLQNQFQSPVDMYYNSLGLNGAEGNAAAVGAFQNSPGFQAALDRANQNVLRNQSATGALRSGATGMALSDRARDLQNLDYGNWQSRLAGFVNPLMGAYGGQAQGLYNLGDLFANEGRNLAGTRMQGAQLASNNSQALGQAYQDQAMADYNAGLQDWNIGLGIGKAAAGAYFGV